MPLAYAETFLAAAKRNVLSAATSNDVVVTWERDGRNVAGGHFPPPNTAVEAIVQISETKQFAGTVFKGKDAKSLQNIGQTGTSTTADVSSQPTLLINQEAVEAAFRACLYNKDELQGAEPLSDAILVESVMGTIAFHPQRLQSFKQQVETWLKALPHTFQKDHGGGMSLFNACVQDDGEQWTGFHQRCEQLFCLGIGLGLAQLMLPRELWPNLPGGMPYYVITV